MSLPRPDDIILDIDPDLFTDPLDTDSATLTDGSLTLTRGYEDDGLYLREDSGGVRYIDSRRQAYTPSAVGIPQSTMVALVRFPSSQAPEESPLSTTFATHAASNSLTVNVSPDGLDAWISNTTQPDLDFDLSLDRWQVWAITFDDTDGMVAWYVDGQERRAAVNPGRYLPASTPTLLFGQVYRAVVWDVVLNTGDLMAAAAFMREAYLEFPVSLSWAPPAHDGGSPVTGYLVRIFDGATVTEEELGPDQTEYTFTSTGGYAQVLALSEFGQSSPVEVVLGGG